MLHTLALILKKEGRGEADIIISALTRDFGRIRLTAQGARKHGAKLRGHLEPGTISEISFVNGRGGWRMTGARLAKHFPDISGSLERVRARDDILSLLDANLYEDRDRAAELFSMCEEALSALERADGAGIPRLGVWFRVRFLEFMGVLPHRGSPEALEVPALFLFGSLPAEAAISSAVSDELLQDEFRRVASGLGGAVSRLNPVAFAELAV